MRTSTILPAILIAGPALPALAAPVYGYNAPTGQAEHVHPQSHGDYAAHKVAHVHHLEEATPKTSGMRAHASSPRPWAAGAHRESHGARAYYPGEYHVHAHVQSAGEPHMGGSRMARPPSPAQYETHVQEQGSTHHSVHASMGHYTRAMRDESPMHHQLMHAGAAPAAQRPHRRPSAQQHAEAEVHVPGQAAPEHERHAPQYAHPEYEHTARALGPEDSPSDHRLKRVGTRVGLAGTGMSSMQRRPGSGFSHGPVAAVHAHEQATPEHGPHAMHQAHLTEMEHPPREFGADETPAQHRVGRMGNRIGAPKMATQQRPSAHFSDVKIPAVEAHAPAHVAAQEEAHVPHLARPGYMGHAARAMGGEEPAAQHRHVRPDLAEPSYRGMNFRHAQNAHAHVPGHNMAEEQHDLHAREYQSLVARKNKAKAKKAAEPKPKPAPKPAPKPSTQSTTQHRWNEANQDIKNVGTTVSEVGSTVGKIAKVGHGIWDAVEDFLKREDAELEARDLEGWLMEREYEVDELD